MPNALAHEKSPYLLQHAGNPVAWLPWGEPAFARARAEQKPIFLSIGYATCHWCHVMAHESFEDPAVAAVLNEHFIPIKVDREERPDVDKVYMAYVQAMTGHGGWPLSAWLTPDLKPFYGGTYFPPEDRQGRSGFLTILNAIVHGWAHERPQLLAEGDRVIAALRDHATSRHSTLDPQPPESASASGSQPSTLNSQLLDSGSAAFERGFNYFYEAFDAAHGGFGGAPKFPRAPNLHFLFRVAAIQGVASEVGLEAIKLATSTLRAMARGGIHDHVGGGFHRYAVDEAWFVPHFEKMLYDQAQIALNALEARQATGDERFAWLARDIFAYVLRDLAHPSGGYYSAEDADSLVAPGSSEHAEGAFYVWTPAQLAAAVGPDAAPFVAAHFGVVDTGNVPEPLDPQGELSGKCILAQTASLPATAAKFSLDPEVANDRLLAALAQLRTARAARPRPLRDDKIIAAWNGLMLSALARAHQVLGPGPLSVGSGGRPDRHVAATPAPATYLAAATRTAEFLQRELYDSARGVLYRSWREGRGAAEGFAEDYACLIQGLLDLYEAGFELRWLQWAEQLQQAMDARFWDAAHGGYFNSRADDPSIVLRLKEDYDGAEPAASSVAAANLLRLGALLHDESLRDRGRRTLLAFRAVWSETPQALPQMLAALELALDAPRHVVLAGDPRSPDFQVLAAVLHEKLGPRRALLAVDGGPAQAWLAARAPWLAGMRPIDGRATAYVCEDYACQAPVNDPARLKLIWS